MSKARRKRQDRLRSYGSKISQVQMTVLAKPIMVTNLKLRCGAKRAGRQSGQSMVGMGWIEFFSRRAGHLHAAPVLCPEYACLSCR